MKTWPEIQADLIEAGEENIRDLDGRAIEAIAIYVDRLKALIAELEQS